MVKCKNVLLLAIIINGTSAFAQLNVMTDSIIVTPSSLATNAKPTHLVTNAKLDNFADFAQVTVVPKNRNQLIQEAALAATAAYNHKDLVNTKSPDIRDQDDYIARETMVANGDEIITFSAKVKKNALLGNRMAHGQLPAGLVSYSVDNNGKATIRLAYHGTECLRDLATDANALKKYDKQISSSGYIHGGFYNRYMESREAMFDVIQGILEAHNKTADQVDFVVTGHSLGGALASIAAVDLKKQLASKAKLDLVTFSSPRVFDPRSAAEAERVLGNRAIRIWRESDPIPTVSLGTQLGFGFMTGFKHIGTSIKLERTVNKFDMENHAMSSTLKDAISQKDVTFTTEHEGIKTRIKKTIRSIGSEIKNVAKTVVKKLNPLKWWS